MEDFGKLSLWMTKNKLTLHVGKTKSQLIGYSKKGDTEYQIIFAHKAIKQVQVAILFRVNIDSNLTWASQYEPVRKR